MFPSPPPSSSSISSSKPHPSSMLSLSCTKVHEHCCSSSSSSLIIPPRSFSFFSGNNSLRRANITAFERSILSIVARADASRKHRGDKEVEGSRRRVLAECDVVIVGAGIIGLAIANRLLTHTSFSVAIVDARQPCAGASGAGQGYVWLGHLQPQDEGWSLAYRSKKVWEDLASELRASGLNPHDVIGWKKTGSMIVADTHDQALKLRDRVEALQKAGVHSEYLDAALARKQEPVIWIDEAAGAAFAPEDCQIDARLATLFLQRRNRDYSNQGRYIELFHNEVTNIIFSSVDVHVRGVQTFQGIVYSKNAVVIAAGSWTASVMQSMAAEHDFPLVPSIKPRKGHLLVLEGFPDLHLNHGLMEASYKEHKPSSHPTSDSTTEDATSNSDVDDLGIAMTATIDSKGCLLLGSSRQFVGFDETPVEAVIQHILQRAAKFLVALRSFSTAELRKRTSVRIGFRPYISDEKPVLGPVAGMSGLFLASGHEGSGLTMAPASAEIIESMISGKLSTSLDPTPFLPSGRLRQQ